MVPLNQYRALIDTGATRTCLSYRAIGNEGLFRHGRKLVRNVHNQNFHGLYMAEMGIFATDRVEGGKLQPIPAYYGLPDPIEVMDIADNEGFDAIIGMDILENYDFEFSRAGKFTIFLP